MNKENKFAHLEQWCKDYFETSGLKVHPTSVPTDVVMEDMLGRLNNLVREVFTLSERIREITQKDLNTNAPHSSDEVVNNNKTKRLKK